jgi:transcriptional regulator with XRE-family HTH domain
MDVKRKARKRNMGNKSELARRIKALRGEQSQAKFAKRLEVTQPMISSFEAGREEPTTDNLLALAALAGYPECFWFWERAGLNRQKLLAAAENIRNEQTKDLGSPTIKGQVILIPCVRKTSRGLEATGEHVPMPAVKVANPVSTYCFLFRGQSPEYTEFAPIVDTTNADAEHLAEFLGSMVLAEFSMTDSHSFFAELGLRVGGLFWEEGKQVEEGHEEYARFAPLEGHPCGALFVGKGVVPWKFNVAVKHPTKTIRPWPGFTILGRVIAL